MRVLVAAASKHGATAEIADRITEALTAAGLEAVVGDFESIGDLGSFQAAVFGSGVYAGNWMKSARRFVEANAAALSQMPVWIFSSGPIGDPLKPAGDTAVDVGSIVEATEAEDHRLFSGRLDRSRLSFGERAIVKAFRSPEGDFRDWAAIEAWAGEIAAELRRR